MGTIVLYPHGPFQRLVILVSKSTSPRVDGVQLYVMIGALQGGKAQRGLRIIGNPSKAFVLCAQLQNRLYQLARTAFPFSFRRMLITFSRRLICDCRLFLSNFSRPFCVPLSFAVVEGRHLSVGVWSALRVLGRSGMLPSAMTVMVQYN